MQQLICGSKTRGRTEQSVPLPCTPQPEICYHHCGQGLVLELRVQRSELGRGLDLAVWKQPQCRGCWNPLWPQLRVYTEDARVTYRLVTTVWRLHEETGETLDCRLFPSECTHRGPDTACTGSSGGQGVSQAATTTHPDALSVCESLMHPSWSTGVFMTHPLYCPLRHQEWSQDVITTLTVSRKGQEPPSGLCLNQLCLWEPQDQETAAISAHFLSRE